AVVETQPTCEFPDPLNGIQIGAIGWQEVQAKLGLLLVTPLQMEFGTVVLGVVADGHHSATAHALASRNSFRNSQKVSPLNLPVSRRNRNWPSRRRTAAK